MSKIDWRTMFKDVLARMRAAGESNEMGARWMATEADNAVYAAIAAKDAEINRLQGLIEAAVAFLVDKPEYHYSGMGCGIEDRGITDRYDAMLYGWEEAMERVYGENIAWAKDVLKAASIQPTGIAVVNDLHSEEDYRRGAEADFQSHVQHLRNSREWE